MIRKFEKNDIEIIMQIWKNENIKAHKFISKEYWENNYNYVKEILPNAEIYVYIFKENIVGFIGINENYQITTVPVILGSGIRLFEENNKNIRLEMKEIKEENGLVMGIYARR